MRPQRFDVGGHVGKRLVNLFDGAGRADHAAIVAGNRVGPVNGDAGNLSVRGGGASKQQREFVLVKFDFRFSIFDFSERLRYEGHMEELVCGGGR
jgi:hypothetical protein